MAAGDRPTAVLAEDLDAIGAASGRSATTLRRAAYHLRHVAPKYYIRVAEMLTERDGVDAAAARADVGGHIMDAAEVVAKRLGTLLDRSESSDD
jgi:hypothetical protein